MKTFKFQPFSNYVTIARFEGIKAEQVNANTFTINKLYRETFVEACIKSGIGIIIDNEDDITSVCLKPGFSYNIIVDGIVFTQKVKEGIMLKQD